MAAETAGWWSEAACRGLDPNVFHPSPDDVAGLRAAVAVCETCPVRDECLRYALETGEEQGVWGGVSGRARKAMRRNTKAAS